MTVRDTARHFGSGTAALYRRYAEWLVSISWKRFIVLSILFMIAMGVLSDLPPFSWDLVPAKMEATGPLHSSTGGTDVTVDDHGVQIRRKADPATGKPAREIVIDEKGVQIRGGKSDRSSGAAADEIKAEIGALADEIREDVADALAESSPKTRVRHVRLGDHLPGVAFLLVLLSAVIKMVYAGRVKAEAQAVQAQEVADAESLKRQVLEARMAAMQAQVEPHFLFNTLASIDHLIEVDPPRASRRSHRVIGGDPPRASRMQKHLIALLRPSMPAMRETSASLGRELDVVR